MRIQLFMILIVLSLRWIKTLIKTLNFNGHKTTFWKYVLEKHKYELQWNSL